MVIFLIKQIYILEEKIKKLKDQCKKINSKTILYKLYILLLISIYILVLKSYS